jgi:hypothetical protein
MRLGRMVPATVAAVALFAAPGCTKVVAGTAVHSASDRVIKSNVCEQVSAPMASVPARATGEPRLRIPQPSRWHRTKMLDSQIIRFAMANKDLGSDEFVPTAVVTLESAPGATQDQQKIFDQERAMLTDQLGVTNMQTTETTLCGHKAELLSYDAPAMGRIPPRKAKTLVAVCAYSGTTYAATVTVQAADPDNPGYVRDAQTILTGFQMLPPHRR